MLSCDTHDYVEIACLFRYLVELQRRDGGSIIGRAITTSVHPDHGECLIIEGDQSQIEIPLSELNTLRVLTPHARFQSIDFK